jgi:hypothetical protein
MARPIKVLGTYEYIRNKDGRNQHRTIMPTTGMIPFAKAMGIPVSRIWDYTSETKNTEELAVALAAPGVPLYKHPQHGWRACPNLRDDEV